MLSTLSRTLAVGLTLALLPFAAFDLVVSNPVSAAGTDLYAFAGGEAAAPASCPDDTAMATDQCTLAQALSLAGSRGHRLPGHGGDERTLWRQLDDNDDRDSQPQPR